MAIPTYRILASLIPFQAALMLGFAWYAARPPAAPAVTQQADHIVISKSHHTLILYAHGQPFRTYAVALGRAAGPKQFQGDHKTPEGHYTVDSRNPHSTFHLALHLSYPNATDRAQAAAAHRAPGGDVEIHGLPAAYAFLGPLHRATDWTDGCIALTNPEIDEVYRLTPNGTIVEINP
jgi:murein L,D-transpeptidase YafK